jgi:hypothetical protein
MSAPTVNEVRVECYVGYRGEEAPRRFHLEDRAIEIIEVLARWTEPDARLFRVRGDDGRVYVLRRNEREECWDVTELMR